MDPETKNKNKPKNHRIVSDIENSLSPRRLEKSGLLRRFFALGSQGNRAVAHG
jgi:hypothetical protein